MSGLRIIIPGDPIPKGRPRARIVTPKGKKPFVSVYSDSQTEKEERRIRWEAAAVMASSDKALYTTPVKLYFEFYMPIPSSFSKRQLQQIEQGLLFPAKRPDIDNLEKLIMDAFNGVVYDDDKQVIEKYSIKKYSKNPGTIVTVTEIGLNHVTDLFKQTII